LIIFKHSLKIVHFKVNSIELRKYNIEGTPMAVATRKRTKASNVKQESIGGAISLLEELPEKPKEDLSLRQAVEQMRDSIKAALAKGYSYADIADMLTDKGIRISALTLKNYVPAGKRQASKTKTRRPRKSANQESAEAQGSSESAELEAATDESSEATTETTEQTPTPTKSRRGRRSAAKNQADSSTTVKSSRGRRSSTAKEPAKATRGRRKASASE
jgi:hypothetical protein